MYNSDRGRFLVSWLPSLLTVVGLGMATLPIIVDTLFKNYYFAAGVLLLFTAWIGANLQQKKELVASGRWQNQKKAMVAMSGCIVVGLALLSYYELQMPKYNVAMTDKELYRVPPQLNKKQLRELGAECNTYGDTLCSHAVFAKIVKLDPRDYFALANLAMAQSHLGFHDFAIRNFKNAIQNGVKRYDVYKFYGHSLLATNQKKRAILAYSASLNKNPEQSGLRKKVAELKLQ